jgi:hypothetical protein
MDITMKILTATGDLFWGREGGLIFWRLIEERGDWVSGKG